MTCVCACVLCVAYLHTYVLYVSMYKNAYNIVDNFYVYESQSTANSNSPV